jgi:regulator of protease activity HflC (stomatin/prohibitin superfamily)
VIGTRIVQDIISRYTVDELCAPLDPDRDPRVKIASGLKNKLEEVLAPQGIEVVGGGISNLVPQDKDNVVLKRRLDSWRTEWQCKIIAMMSAGEAERKRQIEMARAEAETEIALKLGRIIEESIRHGGASRAALALRFVDCLGEIVSEANGQWPLPDGIEETLKRLRGGIEARER